MAITVHCAFSEMVPVEGLVGHPQNPNSHPKRQVELLAKVIEGNGWRAPIVVSKLSSCIVAGHGRFLAAQHLGLDVVPVDFQDFASEEAEKRHLLADNAIADYAEMQQTEQVKLIRELEEMDVDLEFAGFDGEAFAELLGENDGQKKGKGPNEGGNENPGELCEDCPMKRTSE